MYLKYPDWIVLHMDCLLLTVKVLEVHWENISVIWENDGCKLKVWRWNFIFSESSQRIQKCLSSLYCLTSWTVCFSENNVGKWTYICIVLIWFFSCLTYTNLLLIIYSCILGDYTAVGIRKLLMSLSPHKKWQNLILKIQFFQMLTLLKYSLKTHRTV